jgi:hypothetical protein
MPLTAAGRHEVSIVTAVDGKDKELCRRTFRYVPVPRFLLLVLLLAIGAISRFQPRYWILTTQRRLAAIPLVAFLLMLMTPTGGTAWLLSAAFAQLTGLSLLLLYAGSARPSRPIVAGLVGYAACVAPAIPATLYIASSLWDGTDALAARVSGVALAGCLASLCWYVPALAGLIAIRKHYSITRLLGGMGVGIVTVLIVSAGLFYTFIGSVFAAFISIAVVILAGAYPGGLLIAMTTSPWCRAGILRTFNLDQDRPRPPPLPKAC